MNRLEAAIILALNGLTVGMFIAAIGALNNIIEENNKQMEILERIEKMVFK